MPQSHLSSLLRQMLNADQATQHDLYIRVEPLMTTLLANFYESLVQQRISDAADVRDQQYRRLKLLFHSRILKGLAEETSPAAALEKRWEHLLIIQAAHKGAKLEQDRLYRELHPVVLEVCKKRLKSLRTKGVPLAYFDQLDAPQEMWAMLLGEGLAAYEGGSSLDKFVGRAIWRRLGDYATRSRTSWNSKFAVLDGSGKAVLDKLEDTGSISPEDMVPPTLLHQHINDVLTERQREVWDLHLHAGSSNKVIGDQLGMKRDTVAVTLSQIRSKLRGLLRDLGVWYHPDSTHEKRPDTGEDDEPDSDELSQGGRP